MLSRVSWKTRYDSCFCQGQGNHSSYSSGLKQIGSRNWSAEKKRGKHMGRPFFTLAESIEAKASNRCFHCINWVKVNHWINGLCSWLRFWVNNSRSLRHGVDSALISSQGLFNLSCRSPILVLETKIQGINIFSSNFPWPWRNDITSSLRELLLKALDLIISIIRVGRLLFVFFSLPPYTIRHLSSVLTRTPLTDSFTEK